MTRMTIAVGVITLVAGAAGCSGKNSTPTAPSNTVTFNITMSPANEVPPITNAENVARGTATITVHKDTNAIDFSFTVTGFPAGSSLTAAHIHGPNAPSGVAASVFIGTHLTAGTAPALVNGGATYTETFTATADQVAQITANPSQFYFNVHTALNGGGVMRGQLQ